MFATVNQAMQSESRGWTVVRPVQKVSLGDFSELAGSVDGFLVGTSGPATLTCPGGGGTGPIIVDSVKPADASPNTAESFGGRMWPLCPGMIIAARDGCTPSAYIAHIPSALPEGQAWAFGPTLLDDRDDLVAQQLPETDFEGTVGDFSGLVETFRVRVTPDSRTLPRIAGDFVTAFVNPNAAPILARVKVKNAEYLLEVPGNASVAAMPPNRPIPLLALPFDAVYIDSTGDLDAVYASFGDATDRRKFILTRYYHDAPHSRVYFATGSSGMSALPELKSSA
jgi:hypothetical protein